MNDIPVMSDMTGQQILKSMNERNALISDLILEARTFNALQKLEVGATASKPSGSTNYAFVPALAGAEILDAYQTGRPMVLSMFDQSEKKQYRFPFSGATLLANVMWQFKFESKDGKNPLGEPKAFVVTYTIGDGSTSLNASSL